jgi:hypothetical protein
MSPVHGSDVSRFHLLSSVVLLFSLRPVALNCLNAKVTAGRYVTMLILQGMPCLVVFGAFYKDLYYSKQ